MTGENLPARVAARHGLDFWFTIIAIAIGVTAGGCSKSGPSNISSSVFDSAPAEFKQLWNDSMAAWKKHQYPQAATNFVSLQSKSASLSTQQTEELNKAVDEFGQEVFNAANKGDAAATEAVKALRTAGRRSGAAR